MQPQAELAPTSATGASRTTKLQCLDWLVAACAVYLAGDEEQGARPDRSDPPNWWFLDQLALFNNLEPLLHYLLSESRIEAGGIPTVVRRRWEETYYRNHLTNEGLFGTLSEFVRRCDDDGLQVLAWKGPAMAARIFHDAGLRMMSDIDIICRPCDLVGAARIATTLGFRQVGQTSIYHLEFYNNEIKAGLDLHFDLYDFIAQRENFLDRLLENKEWLELEEHAFPAPCREDALVLDLAHILNHDYEVSLKHYLDIGAELRLPGEELDGRRLAQALADTDLTPEFGITCTLVEEIFGIELAPPSEVPREPAHSRGEQESLLEAAREFCVSLHELNQKAPLEEGRTRVGIQSRVRYAFRYLFPRLTHLQALHGLPSRRRALLVLPVHVAQTIARFLGKTRARTRAGSFAPSRVKAISAKKQIYRRRSINR